MCNAIIIGGISYDKFGRALGPFRLRTSAENAGYSVKLIDYAWGLEEYQLLKLLRTLITDETKVLGISAAWFDFHYDDTANKWAKQSFFNVLKILYPNITIVTGGTKTNAHPLLFNNSDWFITGFSDIAFVKLLDHVHGKQTNLKYWKESNVKIIKADEHYPVSNMDDIETVFKKEDGFLSYQPLPLEVSRGCIFKCAFCTHPFLGKKSYDYIRSAESIARELERNYNLFGTYRYTISDDTFNDSIEKLEIVKRAIDLAKLSKFEFVGYIRPEILVTKKEMIPMLTSLGLKGCHLGIESMNSNARKTIGKGMDINRVLDVVEILRDNNVRVHASFITGLPGETEEEMYQTNNFLIENKNRYFHSWRWNALGLASSNIGDGYSLFEKNPEEYGFKTFKVNNSVWLNWINDVGITKEKAGEIAGNCNANSWTHCRFAGWTLAQAWFHNLTEEQINRPCMFTNIDAIVKQNGLERSNFNYHWKCGRVRFIAPVLKTDDPEKGP